MTQNLSHLLKHFFTHSAFSHSWLKNNLLHACPGFWRGIKSKYSLLNGWLTDYLSSSEATEAEISEQHFLFTILLSPVPLFSLLAWSPCPSSVCWGFQMEMNPDGVSGIYRCYAIKAESRCTSISHGWTESMGFWRCKLWVSQWFGALKSHCACVHCAQRPAVADSFTSTHYR